MIIYIQGVLLSLWSPVPADLHCQFLYPVVAAIINAARNGVPDPRGRAYPGGRRKTQSHRL